MKNGLKSTLIMLVTAGVFFGCEEEKHYYVEKSPEEIAAAQRLAQYEADLHKWRYDNQGNQVSIGDTLFRVTSAEGIAVFGVATQSVEVDTNAAIGMNDLEDCAIKEVCWIPCKLLVVSGTVRSVNCNYGYNYVHDFDDKWHVIYEQVGVCRDLYVHGSSITGDFKIENNNKKR